MSTLEINDLRAGIDGTEIIHGLSLTIASGEVHAIMGPNGSGKSTLSHVLMGHPSYELTGGSIVLDGVDITRLAPWERAQAGLFLAPQYPTEVPGVALLDVLEQSFIAGGRPTSELRASLATEAARIGFDERFLLRPMNVDLSGGEKKRNETLQLSVLAPKFAILDEIDSGLDVDALRAVSRRVEESTADGLGVLAITHYNRLLQELHPDHVHVLVKGEILRSGGPDLATELELTGYAEFLPAQPVGLPSRRKSAPDADPFADPLA